MDSLARSRGYKCTSKMVQSRQVRAGGCWIMILARMMHGSPPFL